MDSTSCARRAATTRPGCARNRSRLRGWGAYRITRTRLVRLEITSLRFTGGMFIGQHGSESKAPHGDKVIFVPFVRGMPAGQPIDVLSVRQENGDAMGGR